MLNLEGLPSSALFQDFCDALAKRLEHDWVQGTAVDIKRVTPGASGSESGADAVDASGSSNDGGGDGADAGAGSAGAGAGTNDDAANSGGSGGSSDSGGGGGGGGAAGAGGTKYEVTTTHTLPDGTKEDRTLIADAVILATGRDV